MTKGMEVFLLIVLPADVAFWSQQGIVQPQRTAIDAGHGSISKEHSTRTIRLLQQLPSSAIRKTLFIRTNGFYEPKVACRMRHILRQHPVPISIDQPLNLRYRMVIQADGHQPKRIEKLSKQF